MTQPAALSALLDKLSDDIRRADGDAAVETMHMIRAVAGPQFADELLYRLIDAGLSRLIGGQR